MIAKAIFSGRKHKHFDGAIGEDVVVVDPNGNAIPVKEGNWLGGSKDGVWIEEKQHGTPWLPVKK